jgi:hypothetical protein
VAFPFVSTAKQAASRSEIWYTSSSRYPSAYHQLQVMIYEEEHTAYNDNPLGRLNLINYIS